MITSLFQKTFILSRPGVAIFPDIIKIVTMLQLNTRQPLKIQEMLKE